MTHLLGADVVHLYLVKRDHFRREGRNHPLGEGITGYVQRHKEIVNLSNPAKASCFRATVQSLVD